MNDQELYERASIAAMQGILSNPNNSSGMIPTELADYATQRAEALVSSISQGKKHDDLSLEEYIKEVDETHARHMVELTEKLEALQFRIDNLIRIAEKNAPGWINESFERYPQ